MLITMKQHLGGHQVGQYWLWGIVLQSQEILSETFLLNSFFFFCPFTFVYVWKAFSLEKVVFVCRL